MQSRRGRKTVSLVSVAMAFVGLVVFTKPARAVDPVTAVEFIEKAYSVGLALLSLGGSHLNLDQVRADIINEIRQTRNFELLGRVDSLIDRFGEIARNPPLMSTPEPLQHFLADASDVMHEMQRIIRDGDVEQGYNLTSAYNVLSILRVSAMLQLKEDRVSIHHVLYDTLNTNYQMIGARQVNFCVDPPSCKFS